MMSQWFQLDERLKARLSAWPSAERLDGPILTRCSRPPPVKCTITRQAKLVLAGEFCKTFNTMVCCGNDRFRSADFTVLKAHTAFNGISPPVRGQAHQSHAAAASGLK